MPEIRIVKDDAGIRLQVDGEDFMVQGVSRDYFPVGTARLTEMLRGGFL